MKNDGKESYLYLHTSGMEKYHHIDVKIDEANYDGIIALLSSSKKRRNLPQKV